MKTARGLVFLAIVATVVAASPRWTDARSWVDGRNYCNATMMGHYRGMLDREPSKSWALSKLLRCISAKGLARQYAKRIKDDKTIRTFMRGFVLKAKYDVALGSAWNGWL